MDRDSFIERVQGRGFRLQKYTKHKPYLVFRNIVKGDPRCYIIQVDPLENSGMEGRSSLILGLNILDLININRRGIASEVTIESISFDSDGAQRGIYDVGYTGFDSQNYALISQALDDVVFPFISELTPEKVIEIAREVYFDVGQDIPQKKASFFSAIFGKKESPPSPQKKEPPLAYYIVMSNILCFLGKKKEALSYIEFIADAAGLPQYHERYFSLANQIRSE